MSDQPSQPGEMNDGQDQAVAAPPEEEKSGPSMTRIMMYSIGGLAVFLVGGFVIALIFALTNPAAATGFQIIRDFFIIVLALEGIIIGAAMALLVLQLARLTNLLQNEIKPILDQTNETVQTVRGTATFVSKNIADPVIRARGVFVGLSMLLREWFGLRRVMRQARRKNQAEAPSQSVEGGEE